MVWAIVQEGLGCLRMPPSVRAPGGRIKHFLVPWLCGNDRVASGERLYGKTRAKGTPRHQSGTGRGTRRGGIGSPPGLPHTLAPKLKRWIALDDQGRCGHGRVQLLRAIDALGSIRKAAAQCGLSYRRVWGSFQVLAPATGVPSRARRVGDWGHGSAVLTLEGRTFLTQYEAWRAQVDALVQQSFAVHFPARGSNFCSY